MSGSIAVLEGSTFVVSDRRGDIEASPTDTTGLFADDTRFLSPRPARAVAGPRARGGRGVAQGK